MKQDTISKIGSTIAAILLCTSTFILGSELKRNIASAAPQNNGPIQQTDSPADMVMVPNYIVRSDRLISHEPTKEQDLPDQDYTCDSTTPIPDDSIYTPETTDIPLDNAVLTEPITEQPVYDKEPICESEPITYYFYDNWTWIGDSRTVGMSQCVGIDYFAKSAMGLDWFLDNYDTICSFRNQTIVINLGINDIYNAYNYVNVFNNLPDEFTSSNCIYIMAINPVDENKEWNYGYSTANASIENFNNIICNNLRSDFFFIDTYSYLQNDGFGTTDGLHYDAATYVKIYNYMIHTITGM